MRIQRVVGWISIVGVIVVGAKALQSRVPKWSDVEYDRFDGRVILKSFQSKFSGILNSKYDREHNDYLEIPLGTAKDENIPNRYTFSLLKFHYVQKIEPFWKRVKESQATVEAKGVYLVRDGMGQYYGNEVDQQDFYRGSNPMSCGIGSSDVKQDSNFNGPLLADKIGTLKKNSRLRLNQDFYFVQVYDQFRVYTDDDLPWSIRNLMKGRIKKIFEMQAGYELPDMKGT